MTTHVDIAVIGSGASGIAAAVSAARAGCATLLLDQRSCAGGTGGFSGLTTLCGLYDDSGNSLNEGFSLEFVKAISESPPRRMGRVWVLPYRPEKFRQVADAFFAEAPRLASRWGTALAEVCVENSRIARVNGCSVGAVIDCSGNAEVARAIGLRCVETDESTQAPAVIFPLHHVVRDLTTPAAVAQVLLPLARAGFPPLSFQPNVEPETVTVKFTGGADQVLDIIDFLRAHVGGFEKCKTPLQEFTATPRAGRMIPGQYLLTGADVLAGRKFSDGVARCAWPIEQWATNGVARFRYLPSGTCYEIPARSLRAAQPENLFMAGKTISADVDAIASARVMGCCLATGAAAAKLAATYLETAAAP